MRWVRVRVGSDADGVPFFVLTHRRQMWLVGPIGVCE
jgi:hypothetical protein